MMREIVRNLVSYMVSLARCCIQSRAIGCGVWRVFSGLLALRCCVRARAVALRDRRTFDRTTSEGQMATRTFQT